MAGVDALVEATTRWYLAWQPERQPGRRRSPPGARASSAWPRRSAISAPTSAARAARSALSAWSPRGVPEALARAPRAARRSSLHAPDVIAVAEATGREPRGGRAGVLRRSATSCGSTGWRRELDALRAVTRMQRWAMQAVREDAPRRAASWPQTALRRGRRAPRRGGGRALRRLARRGRAGASPRSCARSRARASPTSPGSRWRCASCGPSSSSAGASAGARHPSRPAGATPRPAR